MQLKAWTFSKKHNSTAQPTGSGTTYNVVLKEDCSVDNPVFILGTGITPTINYCQALGHYYFIDNIVILTKDQVELHCSMDVLATYKTEIGNYTAFVERAASSYNTMIADYALSETQQVQYQVNADTQIFTNASSTGVYVLGVIGGYGSGTGGISTYVLTPSELADALDFMFSDGNFTDVLADSVVKSFFNPFQYIVFLRWYPLTKADFGTRTSTTLKFGWWSTTGLYEKLNDIRIFHAANLTIPTLGFNDFRDYDSRYTQMMVEIPTVGSVPIDPSILSQSGSTLLLGVYVDIATGETVAFLQVNNSGGNKASHIGSYQGHMGASIPLAQMSENFGSIASTAGTAVGAIISQSPTMALEAFHSIQGDFTPTPSMLGTYGSRAYYEGMIWARVSVRQYACGHFPVTVYGRPLCENRQINTLTGFVKCQAASIALAAPLAEINEVNNYLNSGFYYE